LGIYKLRFLQRRETHLDRKPPEPEPDDPRAGFNLFANPVKDAVIHLDYGLANLRRLSSASNYPDTTTLDK
jgi:hypothetical protein